MRDKLATCACKSIDEGIHPFDVVEQLYDIIDELACDLNVRLDEMAIWLDCRANEYFDQHNENGDGDQPMLNKNLESRHQIPTCAII